METDWSLRENKDIVRSEIFRHVLVNRDGKSLRSYVGFPGWDPLSNKAGQDIRKGISMGAITPGTEVVGFEKDSSVAGKIAKDLSCFPNINVKASDILDSRLSPASVDFAFLDFTGTITEEMYRWLEKSFLPSLIPGSSFAIALTDGREEGKFLRGVKERLSSDLHSKFLKVLEDYELYERPAMAVQLFIFKCVMRDYHNISARRWVYHDGMHVPMMVYLFEKVLRLGKGPRIYPDLRKGETMSKVQIRHLAAIKAWETRRSPAWKRHKAALKAWETRRSQTR